MSALNYGVRATAGSHLHPPHTHTHTLPPYRLSLLSLPTMRNPLPNLDAPAHPGLLGGTLDWVNALDGARKVGVLLGSIGLTLPLVLQLSLSAWAMLTVGADVCSLQVGARAGGGGVGGRGAGLAGALLRVPPAGGRRSDDELLRLSPSPTCCAQLCSASQRPGDGGARARFPQLHGAHSVGRGALCGSAAHAARALRRRGALLRRGGDGCHPGGAAGSAGGKQRWGERASNTGRTSGGGTWAQPGPPPTPPPPPPLPVRPSP